ncbi:HEPN domain-containing protein [Novosphingobium sp. PhB165]|uniref:HEPN domain-containing protein n=1 Tax=Novosphingobium sp. PhB165 TaxID=2485105 RepID=UPI0010ECB67C|nr:HEPN domain-containing protein [Novosphingobium sp. PhB165]TCM14032.1 HEPN domain-containing protein [Novosphingobium sp. PhB165]
MAEEYFEEFFPAAIRRFKGAKFHIAEGHLREAAFDLHQTAEGLYQCTLLVCTLYTPRAHNLNFLRRLAEKISRSLVDAWPRETRAERARFEKLKDAYVKGRYSKHYSISMEDLEWLAAHMEDLGQAVHKVCQEKIAELRAKL